MSAMPLALSPSAIANDQVRPWLQVADRETITQYQMTRLRTGLQRILDSNGFYHHKLDGLDPHSLTSFDALRALPFTTKAEFVADQREHPPYGTNVTFPLRDYVRLHQTSGTTGHPLKVPDTSASWDWWADCWATVYRA